MSKLDQFDADKTVIGAIFTMASLSQADQAVRPLLAFQDSFLNSLRHAENPRAELEWYRDHILELGLTDAVWTPRCQNALDEFVDPVERFLAETELARQEWAEVREVLLPIWQGLKEREIACNSTSAKAITVYFDGELNLHVQLKKGRSAPTALSEPRVARESDGGYKENTPSKIKQICSDHFRQFLSEGGRPDSYPGLGSKEIGVLLGRGRNGGDVAVSLIRKGDEKGEIEVFKASPDSTVKKYPVVFHTWLGNRHACMPFLAAIMSGRIGAAALAELWQVGGILSEEEIFEAESQGLLDRATIMAAA